MLMASTSAAFTMCWLRKDFVGGWCKNCGPSAQMHIQHVCYTDFVGPDTKSISHIPEQIVSGYGVVDSPQYGNGTYHCLQAKAGQDPTMLFTGIPPLARREPKITVPPSEFWNWEGVRPQHVWGWNVSAECIRCDPVHGEMNWMWFWQLVIVPKRDPNRPLPWLESPIWNFFTPFHSRTPDEHQGSPLPFEEIFTANKPDLISDWSGSLPNADTHDPFDIGSHIRSSTQDALFKEIRKANWAAQEGRCCGGDDVEEDDEFFEAYAEEKAAYTAEKAAAAGKMDPEAGMASADQKVYSLCDIDWDNPEFERHGLIAEGEGDWQETYPDMTYLQHEWDVNHHSDDRLDYAESQVTWDDDGSASIVQHQPEAQHEHDIPHIEEPAYSYDDYSDGDVDV
jgi:hypothetical protein